jgi:hypothetical protein
LLAPAGISITPPWFGCKGGSKRVSDCFFEPWLHRVAEAGLQFSIPKSGEPVLEGITPMFADASGVYRGSRFHFDPAAEDDWARAVEVGRRAAACAQEVGYFGPLGIDAMMYQTEERQMRIRPLQDVNARFTMGRLALGFRRLLGRGECGTWLHVRWPTDDVSAPRRHFDEMAGRLPDAVRIVRTSPFETDARPVSHGTFAVFTPSKEILAAAEAQILSGDLKQTRAT